MMIIINQNDERKWYDDEHDQQGWGEAGVHHHCEGAGGWNISTWYIS